MGGEQAATVLHLVELDKRQREGKAWPEEEQEDFKRRIRERCERAPRGMERRRSREPGCHGAARRSAVQAGVASWATPLPSSPPGAGRCLMCLPAAHALPCTAAMPSRRYDAEGQPSFASARLWDDGVIQPQDSRAVLGLSLAAALNRGPRGSRFGVFRM